MKTIALVLTAGFLALAGVALAEQSATITAKVHSPVGEDQDVSVHPTGLPDSGVGFGEHVNSANSQLSDAGVPIEAQTSDDGVRPNARCSADVPEPACITDEPTIPWAQNEVLTFNQDSADVRKWVTVDSKDKASEAFTYAPDGTVDPATRQQIEDANEQVNGAIVVAFDPDATGCSGSCKGLKIKMGKGDIQGGANLADLTAGAKGGFGSLSEGHDALWTPEGFDEAFETAPIDLQSTANEAGAETNAAGDASNGSGGMDATTMALGAAIVGGAIIGPMALYHRIRSNHTLNNKTRQMVYDAVVRSPGIGVNDAAKAADCSYSTAAYHLERLVEERLLIAAEDGRRARYFKNGGSFSPAERDFVPVLQSKEAMNVLQVIVENPWCYRAEVAQKLGVSGPTVNWHLKKLMGVGVVKEMREGRVSYLYADKKSLSTLGANLVGKLPEEQVARLRFERRPEAEVVEPGMGLPETTVPDVGVGEVELAPLAEN